MNQDRENEIDPSRIEREAYRKGLIAGIARYAWWKDGVQYVGTTGRTLKLALAEAEAEFADPDEVDTEGKH